MQKKLLIFILLLLSVYCINPYSIAFSLNADYKRVINDTTAFYSDANGENFLFNLPYTYYVNVLNTFGEYSHVECYGTGGIPALDGYVLTDQLFTDNLEVKSPFACVKITTCLDTVLYNDLSMKDYSQYIFKDRTLNFYGTATINEHLTLYCVQYNGRIGYVKESDVFPFTVPNHPNELTFIDIDKPTNAPTGEENLEGSTDNFFSLRVIVIVCLAFAGILAIFFAFRPRNTKRQKTSYYDENDYE